MHSDYTAADLATIRAEQMVDQQQRRIAQLEEEVAKLRWFVQSLAQDVADLQQAAGKPGARTLRK